MKNWSPDGFNRVKEALVRGNKTKSERNRQAYLQNPKICICGAIIPYEKRRYDHCSQRCGKLGNTNRPWRPRFCLNCNAAINSEKFCNHLCQQAFTRKVLYEKILRRGYFYPYGTGRDKPRSGDKAKRFLIEQNGHVCSICGNTEWMGQSIPLVLDHINGDAVDWSISNLRLLCGNCNMQQPTFGARNKGRGTRLWRRGRKS